LKLDGIIPFGNGTLSTALAGGEQRLYRIDVPADALVWHQTATHDGGIRLYLAQGTVPPRDWTAHWYTGGAVNTSLNQNLTGYPWQPGYAYYLLVENSTAGPLPFALAMNGKSTLSRLSVTITATCPGSNVTTSPNYFTCSSDVCGADITPFTATTLYASPGSGCGFTGWSGACSAFGGGSSCSLSMDQSSAVSLSFVDVAAPRITFSLPATSTSSTVPVTFSATDNVGVTGYCLSESGSSVGCSWKTTSPTTYTFSGLTYNTATNKGLYAYARDAAGNISSSWTTTQITVVNATLTVSLAGSGSGSVNSTPNDPLQGIACTPNCTSVQSVGSSLTLNATPGSNSLFGGWSGGCSGCGTASACPVTFDVTKSCTATFTQFLPARLVGTTTTSYGTPQAAYDAAKSGDVIQLVQGILAGAVNAGKPISVSLKGGYNTGFTGGNTGTTTIGTVTIKLGAVTFDRIVIK
jgi:Divergent InlB B-repeat domain